MQNWKLTLSYDGSAFHGWQVQPDLPTIQGTLAHALHHLTGESILPQGSGRTDTGVHALAQVASFHLAAPIPAANLHRALNRALPPSIRVLSAEPVPDSFHARHSALRKIYEYRLFRHNRNNHPDSICPPFLAPYIWDCPWSLSLADMQVAAAYLLGQHDFTSFAAADPDLTHRNPDTPGINPIKTIHTSTVTQPSDDQLLYTITGSGFLHHMVRNIVGTLVEAGRGAISPADIPNLLAARSRSAAGPTAPAQGLFLVSVHYEDHTA